MQRRLRSRTAYGRGRTGEFLTTGQHTGNTLSLYPHGTCIPLILKEELGLQLQHKVKAHRLAAYIILASWTWEDLG